jgi:hypothetical protein
LSATPGRGLHGLGLYKPALRLLESAHAVQDQETGALGRETASLAYLEELRGDSNRAESLYAGGAEIADSLDHRTDHCRLEYSSAAVKSRAIKRNPRRPTSISTAPGALQKNQPPNELQVRVLEQLATAQLNADDLAAR